jgi:signal transduction histidine kinase
VDLPAVGNEQWFIEARERIMDGGSIVISRAYVLPGTRDWVTALSYGVRDHKSGALSLVSAAMAVSKTQAFWKDFPVPDQAALGLVRDDGHVVARYPIAPDTNEDLRYSTPLQGPHASILMENRSLDPIKVVGHSHATGQTTIYLLRRLKHYPLTVYLRNPEINFLILWWRDVWWAYFLLGIVLAAAAAIYLWSVQRETAWDVERAGRIRELEAANEELAAFTYTVSHDLRGPVRAIDGFTAQLVLQPGASLTPEQLQLTTRIEEGTVRMSRLIDGLLDFSQQSRRAIVLRGIDMQAMAQAVVDSLQSAGGKTQVRIDPMPWCLGDALLVRQVWVNLISNAFKYSQYAARPEVHIYYAEAAYTVSDNGVGFDMSHADKLFGVFSRLHHLSEFDGTGVGLASAMADGSGQSLQ